MDPEIMSAVNHCLAVSHSLEAVIHQDCAEMEECTRGQVLAEYLSAMEHAAGLLRKIKSQLQTIRDEQRLIP